MASVSASMDDGYFLEELRQSARISSVTAHKVGEADRRSLAIPTLKRDSIVMPISLARKWGIRLDTATSTLKVSTQLAIRDGQGPLTRR
jgi:hypothetical protein